MPLPSPFFSVIMPFRNSDDTLQRAADSILTQSFNDLELIMIDNDSSDGSPGIAAACALADPRVKVLPQKEKGASPSRNLGLDHAKGEYIVFCDADDFYMPDALKNMADVLSFSPCDLLACAIEKEKLPGGGVLWNADPQKLYMMLLDPMRYAKDVDPALEGNHFRLGSVRAKAYRRQILEDHNIRFDTRCLAGSDSRFNRIFFRRLSSASILNREVCGYIFREGSLRFRHDPEYVKEIIVSVNLILEDCGSVSEEEQAALRQKAFIAFIHMLKACEKAEGEEKESILAVLNEYFSEPRIQKLTNSISPAKLKTSSDFRSLHRQILLALRKGDVPTALKACRTAMAYEYAMAGAMASNTQLNKNHTSPPLVSVIVPVFHPGPSFSRCLSSLRAQTLWNAEFIIINDGNPEEALSLLYDAKKKDPRFLIINNPENLGPGLSRNLGIRAARGRYLAFVDSDDYLSPDFLLLLYQKAILIDADIAKGSYPLCDEDGNVVDTKRSQKFNQYILDSWEMEKPLYSLFTWGHQSAIYKRSFLINNQIFYGASKNGEDSTFLLKAGTFARRFTMAEEAMYYYCLHNNSAVHNFSEQRIHEQLESLRDQTEFLSEMVPRSFSRCIFVSDHIMYYESLCIYMAGYPELEELSRKFLEEIRKILSDLPFLHACMRVSLQIRMLMEYNVNLSTSVFSPSPTFDRAEDYLRIVDNWFGFALEHEELLPELIYGLSYVIKNAYAFLFHTLSTGRNIPDSIKTIEQARYLKRLTERRSQLDTFTQSIESQPPRREDSRDRMELPVWMN